MIKKDDLIVAIGKTISKELVEKNYTLAKVIDVGKTDLFAKEVGSGTKIFKIPKTQCIVLDNKAHNSNDKTTDPKIGDLVLSIAQRYGSSIERKVGVLIEIIDIPGKYKMAKILKGETTDDVLYSSLVILE